MRADVRPHEDARPRRRDDVIAGRRAARLATLRLVGPPLTMTARLARRLTPARKPSRPDEAPRILLIRPDHLGDVLLATPAAAVLRDALPGARIDWLVGPWSAEMARLAGGPADILALDFPGFTRRPKRSPVEPYAVLLREAAHLRAIGYDAALVLRPDHWWGAMLAAAAGIPSRFGFGVPECRPFLTDMLPAPVDHVVKANQELAGLAARRFGGTLANDGAILPPRFPLSAADADWAASHADSADDASAPLVAIHPGTGAAVKNWLPERWAEVARALAETHHARLVLTGGPGEQALIDQVAARLVPRPATLVGATTIGQLGALFARCALVVGGDSGPLHLAAAVGTPTVRLYGPTDVREFGPWPPSGPHVALAAGLSCQPCRDLVSPPCGAREAPPCMRAIDASPVAGAATRLLRGSQRVPAGVSAGTEQQ